MKLSKETLEDMSNFGLSKSDLDDNGLLTLYHGGVELPERLNKDEIFFMTESKELAEDYARIRGGEVFELKVNPEYLNFNQGSYEIEYELGGIIRNGEIIPEKKPEKDHEVDNPDESYRNFKIGEVLPKSGYEIIDIVIHSENNAQFYLETGNGKHWYDANTVIKYEGKKDKDSEIEMSI